MIDVERAIKTIETSRETHVGWRAWLVANPNAAMDPLPAVEVAGDAAHHATCIAEYDHVLAVLRRFALKRRHRRTGLHGGEGMMTRPLDYEYTEWAYTAKGVFWRMGGNAQRAYEKLEREGWRVFLTTPQAIILRRKIRRGP